MRQKRSHISKLADERAEWRRHKASMREAKAEVNSSIPEETCIYCCFSKFHCECPPGGYDFDDIPGHR